MQARIVHLILIWIILMPLAGYGERDSGYPKLEIAALVAPMSQSQIKYGSKVYAYEGSHYQLRAGVNFGVISLLGFYGIAKLENKNPAYGITQYREDSELGGAMIIHSNHWLGIILGGGPLTTKIEDSGRSHAAIELSGIRAFVGVDVQSCFAGNVCGFIEVSGTAFSKYSKVKGATLKRPALTNGFDVSLGISISVF